MNNTKKIAITISILILFIYILPYLILKQDVMISPWDNFDSYFIWYRTIAKYGWLLPLDFKIPEFLNGIPRNAFHSELIFQVAIFNFLTPLKAYIFIDVFGRIIGFFGMYLLLKDYVLKDNKNEYILCGLSLCFALIPNLLTLIFLTILGQPLWLWAFLNIRKGNFKYYNWLILTLIPFCINFELITPFFLTIIGSIWLYDLITKKNFNKMFFFSILYCSFISLITIYRMIYLNYFDSTFISHRSDWVLTEILSSEFSTFIGAIYHGIKINILRNCEPCALAMNQLIILPIALFSTILVFIFQKKERKQFAIIWLLLLLFSVIQGLVLYYPPLIKFIDTYSFSKQFQLSRFYFMSPLLWYILFALAINTIYTKFNKIGKYFAVLFILLQITHLLYSNPYFANSIKKITNLGQISPYSQSYKMYFSEKQFNEIKEFINLPQNEYKIISIELPYNIASYNGFYVANGFFNLYDLNYKNKLNDINKKLIESDINAKKILKYWGHTQYFVANEAYFDTNILKELGVKYILSGQRIQQLKKNSQIKLLKIFFDKDTNYIIYLYKIL